LELQQSAVPVVSFSYSSPLKPQDEAHPITYHKDHLFQIRAAISRAITGTRNINRNRRSQVWHHGGC
jgi:hypothetical protein